MLPVLFLGGICSNELKNYAYSSSDAKKYVESYILYLLLQNTLV